MPISRRMDKHMVDIHIMEYYLGIKRDETLIYSTTWRNLRHHAEQTEAKCKSIYHVNAFIWKFKNAKLIYDNTNHNKVCFWMVGMT